MFYEWVAEGAIIGIKVFFGIFTFGLFVALAVGLVGMMAAIVKEVNKDDRPRH